MQNRTEIHMGKGQCRKSLFGLLPFVPMKRQKQKPVGDESASAFSEVEDDGMSREYSDTAARNPAGIDALKALQIGGGILCGIFILWFILHNVLRIV